MSRIVAVLLVFAQLVPAVLLGQDTCVSEAADPCAVVLADGTFAYAHEGHTPDEGHDDLGHAGGCDEHPCACVCHTPVVLRVVTAVRLVAAAAALPGDAPADAADGHGAPPFHPPRTA